jgi:hypothetical protein
MAAIDGVGPGLKHAATDLSAGCGRLMQATSPALVGSTLAFSHNASPDIKSAGNRIANQYRGLRSASTVGPTDGHAACPRNAANQERSDGHHQVPAKAGRHFRTSRRRVRALRNNGAILQTVVKWLRGPQLDAGFCGAPPAIPDFRAIRCRQGCRPGAYPASLCAWQGG